MFCFKKVEVLNVLQIPLSEVFALLAAIGFAAGLNLYATVAVLGLLAHFGHLPLPPGLQLLAGWPVIIASITLFGIEFFADKIPAFDLIWNALHTFVRVPVAGLLAYEATKQLSPGHQLLATLLGAAVACARRNAAPARPCLQPNNRAPDRADPVVSATPVPRARLASRRAG